MTSFIALYRGSSIGDAKIVAATKDPSIVSLAASAMLADPYQQIEADDPVLRAIGAGKREALSLMSMEASGGRAAARPNFRKPPPGKRRRALYLVTSKAP